MKSLEISNDRLAWRESLATQPSISVGRPKDLPLLQRVLPSLVSVVGGEILLRIASFVLTLMIARMYGASALGLFATALAYSTLAITAGEAGLQAGAIARISQNPSDQNRIVSQLYTTKTLIFLPLGVLTVLIGAGMGLSTETWIIAGLVSARSLIQSYCQLQLAILKSIDRMVSIGIIQSVHFIVLLAGIVASRYFGWTFHGLLAWAAGCQTVELTLSAGWLWKNGIRLRKVALADCWKLLRGSSPIGLSNLLATLIVRLDVIILSLIVSVADVGRFAAANTIIVVVYVVSWLFGSVLLPDLVRLATDGSAFDRYLHQWTRIVLWSTVPMAVVLFWAAPPVVRTLFGNGFAQSGLLAGVMLLAMPCIFLNSLYMNKAIALGTPSVYLGTYFITAALAFVLNMSFGRLYGVTGVAVAVVVREAIMFTIFCTFHVRSQNQAVTRLEARPENSPLRPMR